MLRQRPWYFLLVFGLISFVSAYVLMQRERPTLGPMLVWFSLVSMGIYTSSLFFLRIRRRAILTTLGMLAYLGFRLAGLDTILTIFLLAALVIGLEFFFSSP